MFEKLAHLGVVYCATSMILLCTETNVVIVRESIPSRARSMIFYIPRMLRLYICILRA